MYQSRLHFANDHLAVAIDSATGDILEINNLQTGENLIKNSCYMCKQPFVLECRRQEQLIRVSHADFYELDESRKATISSRENEDGDLVVTVSYQKLVGSDQKAYNLALSYTITLHGAGLRFDLTLQNHQADTVVERVKFPCINGVYLGEDYEDNTVVYPFMAGLKIRNPIKALTAEQQTIYWKWQEYRYAYAAKRFANVTEKDGLYAVCCAYGGGLSMKWLDYYRADGGIYFASHDDSLDMLSLSMETFGQSSPGMNFAFEKQPFVQPEQTFHFANIVLVLHTGDWHQGADLYRSQRLQQIPPSERIEPPAWFQRSAGLLAHYDFKYQNGGIVHRYKDIPALLTQAQTFGTSHLLFAGWHQDGFDHGYPAYTPDCDLGTEQELIDGIRAVKEGGGHVSFYVNARLANPAYDADFVEENVVVKADGSKHIEAYGNQNIVFGAMCANAKGWQEKLLSTADYLTTKIGIDGLYLDQLGMAPPCVCVNPRHAHKADAWNEGYAALLHTQNSKKQNLDLIYEGVSDAYGHTVAGQLVSTFFYLHTGAFMELYKYTFPEQILVDMLYPRQNLAMRPVHIAQASTQMINKAFVTGAYYWIYDLVDDNTFTRDPKQFAYLKDVITLRKFWLDEFGHGRFQDTVGIAQQCGDADVKLFQTARGSLLACTCLQAQQSGRILLDAQVLSATGYFVEDGVVVEESLAVGEGWIALPQKRVSLVAVQQKPSQKQAEV